MPGVEGGVRPKLCVVGMRLLELTSASYEYHHETL